MSYLLYNIITRVGTDIHAGNERKEEGLKLTTKALRKKPFYRDSGLAEDNIERIFS